MVERVDPREALGAHAALAHRIDRIAFELDDLPVLHMGNDAAVGDAGPAGRVHDVLFVFDLDMLRLAGGQIVPSRHRLIEPADTDRAQISVHFDLHDTLHFIVLLFL